MPAWNPKANELFLQAAEFATATERCRFLDEQCAGDVDLRAQVESLLATSAKIGSFLNRPAAAEGVTLAPPQTPTTSAAEASGTRIGPYKLLQPIGEGGMGVVWMAEQFEPVRRTVALKIVKAGLDSDQVVARFEAERQALSLMDHPNIARVLDAGSTESGRPYFVMELVKGVALTKYCDDHRLTLRQRLELFIPVCQAIQHAHQKGIIHRDIKPSNVLIAPYDGKPVVKVIDFGIAKATGQRLTEKTLFTEFGAVIGTLQYMSPEQAELNNQDIDTRSDIYSLGVLLYELLTGTTPLDLHRVRGAALAAVLMAINEEEPPKPSTRLSESKDSLPSISAQRQTEPAKLTKLVRGELDWIVMKALEKDRNRRYETANGLVRDVERYLADDPVEACPPTLGYRLRKFTRKHKASLVTTTLFLLLILAGTSISVWQAVRATKAEQAARNNESRANAEATKALANAKRADEKAAEATANEKRANDEKLISNRLLYAARMNLAQTAWEETRVAETVRLLDLYQPAAGRAGGPEDLRGFEWHYWNRLARSYQLNLEGHTGNVTSVAFSADGKRLASAGGSYGGDNTVKVWDATSGQETLTLIGHALPVNSVAFSADGKRLASASADGTVKVWDALSGQETLTLNGHTGGVWSVVFSPDGKRLASATVNRTVKVWDVTSGQETLTLNGHTGVVFSVAFSPDGKRLASASDDPMNQTNRGEVRVWDATSGQETLMWRGHADRVWSVAFSPDGTRLASASDDQTVKVWDPTSGQQTLTLKGHTAGVTSVAFSADGTRLATASDDGTMKVWDATSGQVTLTLRGHIGRVLSVAFSPDGTRLASASSDKTAKVWDATSGQEALTLKGHTGVVTSVTFSPDGKRLASANVDFLNPLQSGEVKVWDPTNGRETLTLKGPNSGVSSVAFSTDGQRLALASGFAVKVWDATTGQETLTLKGHSDVVRSVAFSPDGKRLASVANEVKVWDAATGQETLTMEGGGGSVVFSADGKRLASASGDRTVKMWDAASGQETLTLMGHTDGVTSVAFSPDGRRLATASWDHTVKVWDATSGQETLTLKGHTSRVSSVVFSADGNRLASASWDGTVKVWDATPRNLGQR
jgi:WD40 repeat protein/serine/threonine protein kinase